MLTLKVGADPEVFVKLDSQFVSGHGLISGTKKEPFPVQGGAVQVDGMALEFNIDPASDSNTFVSNINSVMHQLESMVSGYEIAIVPVVDFSDEVLSKQPLEALELGCDPDFNAWKKEVNPHPEAQTFRTAAGHIHVGWTEDQSSHIDTAHGAAGMAFARQLDFFLGLPSLLYDTDTRRRSLYGRAGACRIKPYGVEYRVLSNAWLTSDKLKKAVFDNTKVAFDEMVKGNVLEKKFGNIEDIINTSDYDKAIEIMNEGGINYVSFL